MRKTKNNFNTGEFEFIIQRAFRSLSPEKIKRNIIDSKSIIFGECKDNEENIFKRNANGRINQKESNRDIKKNYAKLNNEIQQVQNNTLSHHKNNIQIFTNNSKRYNINNNKRQNSCLNLFEKYKSIYRPHQTLIERYIDKKKENGNCSGVNKRKTKIGRSRNILLSLINDINLNKERGLHNGDPHSQFIKTRNNYKFLTFNTITDSKSNSQLFTQCYNDYYNQTNCTSKILKSSSSSSTAFSQKVKDYLNKKDSISHKDKYSVASKNKTIFNVLKRKLIFTNRLSNS